MQTEHKLQVVAMALLLSLIAIAGPANAQVTGIDDCDETNLVPTPPDFTSCLEDAEPDTSGVPCVEAACPVDPSCVGETPPFVTGCAPAPTPCADGEIGPAAPACAPDPTSGVPCVDAAADCPLPDISCAEDAPAVQDCLPAGPTPCPAGTVGVTAPACVAEPDTSCADDAPAVTDCVPAGEPCPEGEVGVTAPLCAADPGVGDLPSIVLDFLCVDPGLLVDTELEAIVCPAEEPNMAPVVNAGADQSVNEGDVVNLSGSASDADAGDVLTYSWDCVPTVPLSSGVDLATSFTAPAVDEAGLDITCTLAANDGEATTSDQVLVHVNDVPDEPLEFVFVIDSLAAQETGNAVLVTGTVTASVDVAAAAISIALSDANVGLTGTGAQTIVWTDGNAAALDLVGASPQAFEAQVSWSAYEEVAWTVTVDSADGSGSDDFSITFDETATYIDFGAGNAPASLALAPLSTTTYAPDGSAPVGLTSVLTITDTNGNGDGDDGDLGQIVDANAASVLDNDDVLDSAAVTIGAGVNDGSMDRNFPLDVDLPARLQVGTYTLSASYDNPIAEEETGPGDITASVSRSVAVENVDPVVSLPEPGSFLGTERIASIGEVAFSLDDYNAGTLEGGNVAALDTLALAVREASAGACTGDIVTQGLTLDFPVTGGGAVGGAALDFSEVAFSAPIDVTVSLAWATTALAGSYELCATLTDAGGLQAADVLLADFVLTALNGGFHLTIDDGGDGLSAPTVDPGESSSTEALGIAFTGTVGASELVLTVGDFVRSSRGITFTAQDLSGKLCLAATCVGDEVVDEVAAVDGVVAFADLGAVALAGEQLYVVFEFTVPLATAAGHYQAPITVAAVEA